MAPDAENNRTELAQSAWWVHQRQDVYSSIRDKACTQTQLQLSQLEDVKDYSDDHAWIRRAQVIAGQVADFCFGLIEPQIAAFLELEQKVQEWFDRCPASLKPLLLNTNRIEGEWSLPEVRFALPSARTSSIATQMNCLTEHHTVTGYVHCLLARLLLAIHNPTAPRRGLQAIQWHRNLEVCPFPHWQRAP
jgi:hypothetical protein